LATTQRTPREPGEEDTVMRTHRLAALAAIGLFVAACGGGGTPSTAPTQSATQPPATTTPASLAPTEQPITPPTGLVAAGKLTDCVDIEYPPMEMFPTTDVSDPNKAVGFDVDSARAVATKLGLTLDVKNIGFDALIPELGKHNCDIVWTALYVDNDRLKLADAVPYMITGHVIMVPAGNPKTIKSPDDLCGKSISIQLSGVVEKESKAQSKKCTDAGKAAIDIQGYKTVPDEFQQIVLGRVDAVWETDSAISNWMIKNAGKYEIGYAFPPDNTYGVYYTKGNTSLGTALKAAMLALKADGTLGTIADKYAIDQKTLEPIK
jgi:polar amino acid transport system substrate-binding protein